MPDSIAYDIGAPTGRGHACHARGRDRRVGRLPPATAFTRQFGAQFVEVEVDTETGQIRIPDYKLLRCADFPHRAELIFVEDPDPVGPFGARGAGESPIASGISAVCQAVYNATGVWIDLPMMPERVVVALAR